MTDLIYSNRRWIQCTMNGIVICILYSQRQFSKPDDVIKLLSGKTVEINNTDAEGRLILADGVFYARHVLKVGTCYRVVCEWSPESVRFSG